MLKNGKLDHVLHLFKTLTMAHQHSHYLLSLRYSNVLETFDFRVRCLKVSNVFTSGNNKRDNRIPLPSFLKTGGKESQLLSDSQRSP